MECNAGWYYEKLYTIRFLIMKSSLERLPTKANKFSYDLWGFRKRVLGSYGLEMKMLNAKYRMFKILKFLLIVVLITVT